MQVLAVLEAMPGVGKVRAAADHGALEISPSRRVRGLGVSSARRSSASSSGSRTPTARVTGRLTVLSGPSGVGKGSVVAAVAGGTPRSGCR